MYVCASLALSFCLTTILCLSAIAADITGDASIDSLRSRDALYEQFFEDRKLLVVYGASTPHLKEQMRRVLQESSWRWRSEMQIQHVDETTMEDLRQGTFLLVGTPDTNPFLNKLPDTVPVTFSGGGFKFLGKQYREKDVISLMHPSFLNTSYPMFLVAGWDEGEILSALNDRMRTHDYQIVRNGNRLRLGRFSQEPAMLWQFDPEQDMDFEDDIKLVGTTEHFRFYTHNASVNHNVLARLIQQREKHVSQVAAFAEGFVEEKPEAIYKYYLYASLQDKAVITNSMQFAHVRPDEQAVHVAIEEDLDISGEGLNKETNLIVRSWFGKPSIAALEDGLSIYLNEYWFDKPYSSWTSRIAHAGQQMSVEQLLDNEQYYQASPLIREVLAASMVSCMVEQWGRDTFLNNYASWNPKPSEWPHLNHMWDQCMTASKAEFEPLEKKPMPADNAFQKGFNFAHEGYGIVNGYGSRAADEALDKLKVMGTTAVSILPYTFMRSPNQATSLRLANTAGDENDGAVAHASRYAQSIGFTSMIKPQIWLRGSWPGDIDMPTPEQWEAFFGHYEHWITHYALLSEIFEADILCIGNELSKATMLDESRWTSFAHSLRSIYSGQMVYAPNWGEEFESLSFWDAFDYIGVNSYYPLSDLDNPTDQDLLAGAKAVVKKMEQVHKKHKKPILITEIGYPNSPAPWKLPYQEYRRAAPSPEDQARCYQAMISALSGVKWVKGIYWWKWPSYLDRGGVNHRGFTPNRKPAADVVTEWFSSF